MTSIFSSMPFLWRGLFVTIEVSVLVISLSLVAGLLLGVIVTYGPLPARVLIRLFSDVIRGIPILVLIFAVYYGLPITGLNLNNFTSAVIALALFSTAQIIEIARGALQSIHHGQTEAAKAIGLTFAQRLIYVVFPQALRRFLPPWINSVTDVVKGSALVSLVGVVDLMLAIQQVIGRPMCRCHSMFLVPSSISQSTTLCPVSAACWRRAMPISASDVIAAKGRSGLPVVAFAA
jgi:polar amino acid transport system permease protein